VADAALADKGQPEIGDVTRLIKSFERHLRAASNRRPRTIEKYTTAATQLARFLDTESLPTDVAVIRRRDVEAYIAHLLDRYKPGTALTRYQDLQQFFKWCESEDEIPVSPMAKMTPPLMPDVPVPVLGPDQLRALLATCDGKTFDELRDAAILRPFIDTGMRAGELAGLTLTDVDLEDNVALVMGKGRRPRACPFGARTARALDRYDRERIRHRLADDTTAPVAHPVRSDDR
jgi:site-specific recombinase XerD